MTKYRGAIFNEGIFGHFHVKLAEISEHYRQVRFKEVKHDKDHLHMLVTIAPTVRVWQVVGIIKQNTSRELKRKFPFLKDEYLGR